MSRYLSRYLHGLSCKYSAGRFPLLSAINDVIKRALQKASLPLVLEPFGLNRGDGLHLDSKIVFLFSGVRSLVWNCIFIDTFDRVTTFE